MWWHILTQYITFLFKLVTVFTVIFLFVGCIIMKLTKKRSIKSDKLVIVNLKTEYDEKKDELNSQILDSKEYKDLEKTKAKERKKKASLKKKDQKKSKNKDLKETLDEKRDSRVFVIDFDGDIEASEADNLRDYITRIINSYKEGDEVLLRLESPGGMVHGYGFAASQLERLKSRKIKLTIAVDYVAASGGYMMACVADRIIAAPFAILGSIGVVAEVPNIHKLLKKYDVDVDVMTAGEYKRTVTLMGENTQKGKEKFQEELNETHDLFKTFVSKNRPSLNIDKIATGEHWYGIDALSLGLIDEVSTSDDFILSLIKDGKSLYHMYYDRKESFGEKLASNFHLFTNLLFSKFNKTKLK
ncbi:MAG: protease SohB [Psittacicella sp.]